MMESVFIAVLNMSFQASFVIVAILAARLLLSHAPRIISYALWSAAWFRLICPFAIPVRFGICAPIPADIGMQAVPRIDSGIAVLDDAVSSLLPAATPMYSANPMQLHLAVGSILWQAGILVMLLWGILSLLLFVRRLGDAQEVSPGVYVSARIDTPFVLGRRIYLPVGLGESQREMILAHERTHLRRGDPIVKIAAFLVLAVHWFNPLVWAAFVLMSRDMELSCDEAVLRGMDANARRAYARTLLELASGKPSAITPAFGEGDVKARIKNAVREHPARWIGITAAIAAALLGVILLCTNAGNAVTRIAFPETQYVGGNAAPPFTLELILPDGWVASGGTLTCGGEVMATIITGGYAPYDAGLYGPFDPDQYYQFIFSELRTNRIYNWNIGETVRKTESSRTQLAEVYRVINPGDGSPMAGWPTATTRGITCYEDAKRVFIAIDFAEGAVTEDTLREIAQSIRIR